MDEIRVPNDSLLKFYLNDLRFRSLVTLKYLLPHLKESDKKHCVKHSIRFLILSHLTKDDSISKENALYLCQDIINFDNFTYIEFSESFNELKNQVDSFVKKSVPRNITERKMAVEMDLRRIRRIPRISS